MKNKIDRFKDLAEKLARHAESAKKIGNTQEAMTFAAKAAELADRYGFDIEVKDESDYVSEFFDAKYYEKDYLSEIASLYGVVVFVYDHKKLGGYTKFYGKQNNIDCVKHLYKASSAALKKLLKEAFEEFSYNSPVVLSRTDGYNFNRSFYTGVGVGIRKLTEKARNSYAASMNGLMKSERENALNHYKENVRKVRSVKTVVQIEEAFTAGKAAAGEVKAGEGLDYTKQLNQ